MKKKIEKMKHTRIEGFKVSVSELLSLGGIKAIGMYFSLRQWAGPNKKTFKMSTRDMAGLLGISMKSTYKYLDQLKRFGWMEVHFHRSTNQEVAISFKVAPNRNAFIGRSFGKSRFVFTGGGGFPAFLPVAETKQEEWKPLAEAICARGDVGFSCIEDVQRIFDKLSAAGFAVPEVCLIGAAPGVRFKEDPLRAMSFLVLTNGLEICLHSQAKFKENGAVRKLDWGKVTHGPWTVEQALAQPWGNILNKIAVGGIDWSGERDAPAPIPATVSSPAICAPDNREPATAESDL